MIEDIVDLFNIIYCYYVNKIVMDGLKDLGQVKNSDGHSRKTR